MNLLYHEDKGHLANSSEDAIYPCKVCMKIIGDFTDDNTIRDYKSSYISRY